MQMNGNNANCQSVKNNSREISKKHMGKIKTFILAGFTLISLFVYAQNDINSTVSVEKRWTVEKANEWYAKQGWLVGANYVPVSAINQLEMWQENTFDPKQIDKELGWAQSLGFNTMRVFLHHLPWEEDPNGFLLRIETYLKIADKHGIKTMFVLLDDVWHPNPKSGTQPKPMPHVHNSGWVQSPGRDILMDSTKYNQLESYIKGIISHFDEDKRVLIWDLYNEPGNTNGGSYSELEPENKEKFSIKLLIKVYKWSREINPSQPLCIDVWTAINMELDEMSAIDKFAYAHSDIINFHAYANASSTEKMIKRLAESNRPLVCTEYMARSVGSTFQSILPIFKKYNVSAYNWGFVSGKSQTIYPWDSWNKTYTDEPALWFHDILREDGTPYITDEVQFIQKITSTSESVIAPHTLILKMHQLPCTGILFLTALLIQLLSGMERKMSGLCITLSDGHG